MTVVDDIKARLDIVDVVSPYVTLQKTGSTFKANCPFHDERTASFVVNPDRQRWHCFGACSDGGDAFSFVMKVENLDFGRALELLARRTGVELTHSKDTKQSHILYRINRVAANFYQDVLKSSVGQQAQNYLDHRKITSSSSERFMLGFSPDSGDRLKFHLQKHAFDIEQVIESGLVRRDKSSGRTFDFFRNRLMFPIFDKRGNIVGFGARALDDTTPKYINTSTTPIFDKKGTLYALNFAIDAIRTQNTAIIVEGYMDAIAAHEHGYTNVVASMGTALTEQQVAQLRITANKFILALDPDTAGQEAILRSLEASWHIIQRGAAQQRKRSQSALTQWKTIDLRIASLPDGLDPDAIIRQDATRWQEIIATASPLLEFLIPNITSRFDTEAPHGKSQVVDIILPLILSLDPLDQEQYVSKLAVAIGVSLEALRASIGNKRASKRHPDSNQISFSTRTSESTFIQPSDDPVEEYTLVLLLNNPDLRVHAENFDAKCFHNTENREVFTNWKTSPKIEELWDHVDESLHSHLTRLFEYNVVPTSSNDREKAIEQILRRLEKRHWARHQEALLATELLKNPPSRDLEQEVIKANSNIRDSDPLGIRPK